MSYNLCTACPQIISNPCPPKVKDCLDLCEYRWLCGEGPAPKETVTFDVSENNNTSACKECTGVYSIRSYDENFFSSVSITPEGVLTYTTSDSFTAWEEGCITYHFDCPCNNLSGDGYVYICKRDLCTECKGDCNPCNGDCIEFKGGVFGEHPTEDTTNPNSDPNHETVLTYDLPSGCSDTPVYNIVSYDMSQIENVTIDASGRVGYDIICPNNFPLDIVIEVEVSMCGVVSTKEVRRFYDPCGNCEGSCDPCADGGPKCLVTKDYRMEVVCNSSNTISVEVTNAEEFYIVSHPDIFTNVEISNTGLITFDVGEVTNFKNIATIKYRAKCGKIYSDSKILVSFCDLCIGIPHKEGYKCNPCTGLYEPLCVEIEPLVCESDSTKQPITIIIE